MSSVTLSVPATTANLGPGFDCIGAALTLYNQVRLTPIAETEVKILVRGKEAHKVSTDKTNLLYQSFTQFYQSIGQPVPQVEIEIDLQVPLARGLGSSATAIIGGLVGANALAGMPLDNSQLMEMAIAMEGHPDNVVPALIGGCQLCVGEAGNWEIIDIPWHQDLKAVVAIPDFELSTQAARSVLPPHVSRPDAIFNISHLGLLLRALETGQKDWLKKAMEDKLHQPYREALIKGYRELKQATLEAGAYGMVISGAGPTLLALTDMNHAQTVATTMKETWKQEGIEADVQVLSLDPQGTRINS